MKVFVGIKFKKKCLPSPYTVSYGTVVLTTGEVSVKQSIREDLLFLELQSHDTRIFHYVILSWNKTVSNL